MGELILFAEDEVQQLKLMQGLLEAEGYRVWQPKTALKSWNYIAVTNMTSR
jgi:CheY-like chemotaxis protein